MHPSRAPLFLLPLFLVFQGCSSHNKVAEEERAKHSTLVTVRLASDPAEGYQAVHLFVKGIEALNGKSWQRLAEPNVLLDVQNLTDATGLLAKDQRMNKAKDRHFRLRLAPDQHTVTLADGTTHPLLLPETFKDGILVDLEGDLERIPSTHEFVLILDLARSIQQTKPGEYRLWPSLMAVEKAHTGALAGKLLDPDHQPLAGVAVTAQEPRQGEGQGPRVVRTAVTGVDGAYALDLLPLTRTYHVVAAPRVGDRYFHPQASTPLTINPQEPKRTFDFTFQPAEPGKPLLCRIPGPVKKYQPERVELLKDLPGGPFVVQSSLAAPGPDDKESQCQFSQVPLGEYSVRLTHLQYTTEGRGTPVVSGSTKPCAVKTESSQVDL